MRDNCVYLIWSSMIRLMVFTTIFGKPRIHQSHSRITQGEFKECLRFAWGIFFGNFSALYNTITVLRNVLSALLTMFEPLIRTSE